MKNVIWIVVIGVISIMVAATIVGLIGVDLTSKRDFYKQKSELLEKKLQAQTCKPGKTIKKDIVVKLSGKDTKIGEVGVDKCFIYLKGTREDVLVDMTLGGVALRIEGDGPSFFEMNIWLANNNKVRFNKNDICFTGCQVKVRYLANSEQKWIKIDKEIELN